MNRFILHSFVIAAGIIFFSAAGKADVLSTFEAGDEGWSVVSFNDLSSSNYTVVGTYPVTYSATGGNPGGYISSQDPDGGDFTFSAPAAFLGNKLVAIGTTFSYDLNYLDIVNYQTTDVMFVGANGERLLWESSPALVPTPTFTTVAFAIAPSSQWLVNTTSGAQATAADFQAVFSNLAGLYIRGEYAAGSDNTGIDNVRLVPEPGTWAFVGTSLAGLGLVAVRRRSRAQFAA